MVFWNFGFRFACLLIGYVLGNFQTSYILGRTVKKIDIRDHGSGSAGMTNSLRVMGKKFAVVVLLADVAKAFGAFVLCAFIFGGDFSFFSFASDSTIQSVAQNPWLPGMYGAMGAILGHMFPVYMKFRGGKSIACGIGMILALNWLMASIIIGASMVVIILFKYISAASLFSLILLPVALAVFGFSMEIIGLGYCVTVLIAFKHKSNIKRLLNGNENRLGRKSNNLPPA